MRFQDDRNRQATTKQPPTQIQSEPERVDVIDMEQDRPESTQESNVCFGQPGGLTKGNLPIECGSTEEMTNGSLILCRVVPLLLKSRHEHSICTQFVQPFEHRSG